MTLRSAHADFAWFVVGANALVGVWALAAHWVEQLRHRALWWCTVVAEASIFVQVAMGVAIVAREDIEAPRLHTFYGFIALITVGVIYSYRQQLAARRYLLYGLGGLFLMGLGIRAMVLRGR
ncbi:MAG TPA: hypothetical protein VGJ86_25285 [Acidimicrobiales bacterium]